MKEREHGQSLEELIHVYQRCERLQELKGRSMTEEDTQKIVKIKQQAAKDMFDILEENLDTQNPSRASGLPQAG